MAESQIRFDDGSSPHSTLMEIITQDEMDVALDIMEECLVAAKS